MDLIDPCLNDSLAEKASHIGWKLIDFDFCMLESDDWGQLKNEIKEKRKKNELVHYKVNDSKLDRKASNDSRIDSFVIFDHSPKEATIKNLSKNSIALTLEFNTILHTSRKKKNSVLSEWRRTIFLAKKHDIELYVTTGAESKYDLRPPEMLEKLVNSLNGDLESPEGKILRNKEKLESD